MNKRVPVVVASRILFLRGLRVMLDRDLADLYGVQTRALNQAVKRNAGRFLPDFMFQLDAAEKAEVITNCDHLARLKFSPSLPYAFIRQLTAPAAAVRRGIGFTANIDSKPGTKT